MSVYIQIAFSSIIFLVLWRILSTVYFRPFFSLLEQRDARTEGDEKLSDQVKLDAKSLEDKIETTLREVRLRGLKLRDDRVKLAQGQALEIFQQAQAEAKEKLEKERAKIDHLKKEAINSLDPEAEEMAQLILRKILGPDNSSMLIH